jgi:hypothetical protein
MLCSNKRAPFPARLGMPPKALAIRLKRVVAPASAPTDANPTCAPIRDRNGLENVALEAPAAKIDLLEAGFRTGAQISS